MFFNEIIMDRKKEQFISEFHENILLAIYYKTIISITSN